MVDVPAVTPVNDPLELIVATDVLLEFHEPPDGVPVSGVDDPAHNEVRPPMGDSAFTVTGAVVAQLPGRVYVMVTVPPATPATIPEEEPTVAVPVPPLVQVPPLTPSESAVVCPTHTCVVPEIGDGTAFTVNDAIWKQPVERA